jgi:hypothetical protein
VRNANNELIYARKEGTRANQIVIVWQQRPLIDNLGIV